MMAIDMTIAERPVPPKGRLSFPMLILRTIANRSELGRGFLRRTSRAGLGLQTGRNELNLPFDDSLRRNKILR